MFQICGIDFPNIQTEQFSSENAFTILRPKLGIGFIRFEDKIGVSELYTVPF